MRAVVTTQRRHLTPRSLRPFEQPRHVVLASERNRGFADYEQERMRISMRELVRKGCALDYCASFAHSAACTRTTNFVPPLPSGLKIDASPSRTSNQSFPKASMMFGLCETSTTLAPAGGTVAASFFIAAARRLFSFGVTTRPPSVMSAVDVTAPKPSSVPVSTA